MVKAWWQERPQWDNIRLVLVGVGSITGLFFVHPVTVTRILATLGLAAILLLIPDTWFQRGLLPFMVEFALGIVLNFLIPGLGIFPLIIIASDMGSADISRSISIATSLAMGVCAAWGFVEIPGRPLAWSELMLLSGIFALTMWANRNGVRDHRKLEEAYQHLEDAQAEVRELAELHERERIAHELHDVLGHTLTLIILKTQLMQEHLSREDFEETKMDANGLLTVARGALDDIRSVVEANPRALRVNTTLPRLQRSLEEAGIVVTLDWDVSCSWPSELEADILMMIQETITNILRHSQASRVTIRLHKIPDEGRWRLEVRDDGRGIKGTEGTGILGIRRRASTWGGRVTIESLPNFYGTRVIVTGFEVEHG